jgi:hypothetical protein
MKAEKHQKLNRNLSSMPAQPHLVLSAALLLLVLLPPLAKASLNVLPPGVPGGPSLSFCTAERSSGVDAPVLPAAAGLDPSASSCCYKARKKTYMKTWNHVID